MLIDVTPLQAGYDHRNNITLGELSVGEFGREGGSEAGVAVALPRGLGIVSLSHADACRGHKHALLCKVSARFCCRYEVCASPGKMV